MDDRTYIAHIDEAGNIQTVDEHANNVAALAESFAETFGQGNIAKEIGLAHDVGKYSNAFQDYITSHAKVKVDHSSAGAQLAVKVNGMNAAGVIEAFCISGHHAGLLDGGGNVGSGGTLQARLQKKVEDYSGCMDSLRFQKVRPEKMNCNQKNAKFALSFLIRMLFSSLVDADFLDTEKFMRQTSRETLGNTTIEEMQHRLDGYLDEHGYLSGGTPLNDARSHMLRESIDCGNQSSRGLFTLTIPTGGGKTLDSISFALRHAVRNGQRRVIYVIPYCSIIDQTVTLFEKIFGSDCVLAHYSEATYSSDEDVMDPKRLATENWDAPLIVTTSVQFFESLYANKTSKCRKLHNIANSVIVFDEAQLLPRDFLKPCIYAIAELIGNYRCSSVLCTATQPALEEQFNDWYPTLKAKEIAPSASGYTDLFKRVTYVKLGLLSDDELVERLREEDQVLCVVSTRKQAAALYRLLDDADAIHLSTNLTPFDRKRKIEEIKERLANGERCIVVSTSLIEAGVDLDFPIVYRAEAGLDSMIQAAGRCNREGKRDRKDSMAYLFKADPKYKAPAVMQRPMEIAAAVAAALPESDLDSKEMIKAYFTRLYKYESQSLDRHKILDCFAGTPMDFSFAKCAEQMKLIEQNTISILIQQNEESRSLADLFMMKDFSPTRSMYRKAGKYMVNVYMQYRDLLEGDVAWVDEDFGILTTEGKYNDETGLDLSDQGGYGIMF